MNSPSASPRPQPQPEDSPAQPEAVSRTGATKKGGEWLSFRERGSIFGIRFVVFLCTAFGRAPARLFISFLALWYFLFDGTARRASRDALTRLLGRPPTRREVLRNIRTFACVALDRLFFTVGKTRQFEVDFHGEEHMRAMREQKRGAILLMAHLGSFDCGRAFAKKRDFAINIVGNFHNAAMISEALSALNPEVNLRLIDVGRPEDGVDFMFRIQRCIDAGELVAIMADRVGTDGKCADVPLLGGTVSLPTGPYLLAHALGCPVYFACGLFTEPNRYDLFCEPLAERIALPRKGREEALKVWMQKYAAFIEKYARQAPMNWFNFFPYWK